MLSPYVGIVGVKNVEEATAAALAICETYRALDDFDHRAQLGVQVTTKTLNGEITESKRNPIVKDIPAIFRAALRFRRDIFAVIHFTTRDTGLIPDYVKKLFRLGSMYELNICRGLQINGNFGKIQPKAFQQMKLDFPALKIIFQIHGKALQGMSQTEIMSELVRFDGLADYVLVDPSGGQGEELNIDQAVELGLQIVKRTVIQPAFAGGLSGANAYRIIRELMRRLHAGNFSVDAEGGLRDNLGEGYGNGVFNAEKAGRFFRRAAFAFATCACPH